MNQEIRYINAIDHERYALREVMQGKERRI